jgi:hypothetical protein
MTRDQAAGELEVRYVVAVGPKATNADFEKIGTFLRSLSSSELVRACLDRYLQIYTKYESPATRSRSDAAFYLILRRVVDVAKPAELDTWREALTSNQRPFSPLRERFDQLGKTDRLDRDRILEVVDAPKKARAAVAGVLSELNDAYRRTHGHDGTPAELRSFDPVHDEGLHADFRARLAALNQAHADVRAGGSAPIDMLQLQVDTFWAFVNAQKKDGLRLFQLLRWWQSDRLRPQGTVPSSYADDVAYVQIAAALLSYSLATKAYPANIRLKSFTRDEWTFVLAPLTNKLYRSNYESALRRFPTDAHSFSKQCAFFLRLLAFASRSGSTLVSDDELTHVMQRLAASSPAELAARTFAIGDGHATRWYVTGNYRIGQTIGTKLSIIDFEGTRSLKIYVEFTQVPGVVFWVDLNRFMGYAEDAPYDLIYEATSALLTLIPLFFEVLVAVPGIVEGGVAGLVQALLQPVEAAAAGEVMDAFGLDPDNAGWVVLGVNILAHRFVGRSAPKLREVDSGETTFSRGTETIDPPAARRAAVGDRQVVAPDTQAAVTTASGLDGTNAQLTGSLDRGVATELELTGTGEKGLGRLEAEEIRTKPVVAKMPPKKTARLAPRLDVEDIESGKSAKKASRATGDRRTGGSRAVGGTSTSVRGVPTRTTFRFADNVPFAVRGTEADFRLVRGTSVYVLKDKLGTVLYVGEGNAWQRLGAHIADPKKTPWFGEIGEIEIRASDLTKSQSLALEEDLIQELGPLHNADRFPYQKAIGAGTSYAADLAGTTQRTLRFDVDLGATSPSR